MDVILREATHEDAERLISYVLELSQERNENLALEPGEFKLGVQDEMRILQTYAASDNSIFLVAQHEDRIVGVLNCTGGKRAANRHVVTMGLSIHEKWRKRGIGSALLNRAVSWAKANPVISRMELSVFAHNAAAIRLYEKFGFVIEGVRRQAWRKGDQYIDDIVMGLVL